MQTRETIIRDAVNDRMLKAVACGYMVKAWFSNSTIHDYTPKKFAILCGICDKTAIKYVKYLIEKKLAILQGGNLTIRRHQNPKNKRYHCTIQVTKSMTLSQVEAVLLNKLMQRDAMRQQYAIGCTALDKRIIRQFVNNDPLSKRDYKRFVKIRGEKTDAQTVTWIREKKSRPITSAVRHLSRDLNISKDKTLKTIKALKELKLIVVRKGRRKRFNSEKCLKYIVDTTGHYHFRTTGGNVIRINPSRILFCDYPTIPKSHTTINLS